VYLSAPSNRSAERWFQTISAVLFWPLFLPLLLSRRVEAEGESPSMSAPGSPDDLDRAIEKVLLELEGALQSLEGWGESIRENARGRFQALHTAWTAQAGRVREMDQIMARSKDVSMEGNLLSGSERVRGSQEVIRKNNALLEQVRQQTLDDVLGRLARVRELVSMIQLARFTGAPSTRAEELVAQIGAVVEGMPGTIGQQEPGGKGLAASGNVREEICRLNCQP